MEFRGYAMIIGAMKSGTTTLHHLLRQHPAIVTSAGTPFGNKKETNVFKGMSAPSPEEYEAFFPDLDKAAHAYTLDSSTNYTKQDRFPQIPGRIAAFPGRKRLIYVLRDPVERIDSHLAHNVRKGRWTAERFNHRLLLDVSSYARQLAAYEAVGLLADILLVDFAELRDRPRAALRRVYDFLGVAPAASRDIGARHQRPTKGRIIPEAQAAAFRDSLRADVETLIGRYGFAPAKAWGILPLQHPLMARGPVEGAGRPDPARARDHTQPSV